MNRIAVILSATLVIFYHLDTDAAEVARPPNIDRTLSEQLDKKIDVKFQSDYLSEVLDELDRRVGLKSVAVAAIDKSFMFSLEQKQTTVKEILEKLAAEGGLELEYRGSNVVFWVKAAVGILTDLETKLKAGDAKTRCEAVASLARLGDKRIYPLLLLALRDADHAVALKAVGALDNHCAALIHEANSVEPLLKMLSTPWAAECQRSVLWELGCTQDPRAIEPLVAMLKVADAGMRSFSALALAQTQDALAVDPLIALLKDSETDVRQTAAIALAITRDPRAMDKLIAMTKDDDWRMRMYAAMAFGQSHDPRSVELLATQLTERSANVRRAAACALCTWRDAGAIDTLISMCKDAGANQRSAAAMSLSQIRDPRAIDPIVNLLNDDNPGVRHNAIIALGNSRDARAYDLLQKMLGSDDPQTRASAATALNTTRDPRANAVAKPTRPEKPPSPPDGDF